MPTATAFFGLLLAKTTAPAKTSGSGVGELLFFVVLVGLFWAFFLRPRSQAARRQRETLMELSAGDEILTGAGIFGTVLDVADDRVTIETAPGTRITVLRSTIARRLTEPDANSVAEQNWHDEGHHDGVAEAAGWHDPSEQDIAAATHDHSSDNGSAPGHDTTDPHDGTTATPESGTPEAGAPGATQEGER
ncbi:MAG TPA: preprotein translocase subunit YajC [Acidimicrobiales bacterium]|nr:preprotein translocase subunit YajC [Acidimicrobiales bacterium]